MAPERTTERNVHFIYDTDPVEVTHFLYIFFFAVAPPRARIKIIPLQIVNTHNISYSFFCCFSFFFCTIKVNVNKVALKLENERFWLAQSKTREEQLLLQWNRYVCGVRVRWKKKKKKQNTREMCAPALNAMRARRNKEQKLRSAVHCTVQCSLFDVPICLQRCKVCVVRRRACSPPNTDDAEQKYY